METPPASPGLLDSLRRLGDGLLGSVEDRVELLATELQEEKFRLVQTFIWISAAVFTGMLALTFASVTLVYLFWESARLAVLLGLTTAYTAGLVALVLRLRRFVARQPKPLASTLTELREDRACIRGET